MTRLNFIFFVFSLVFFSACEKNTELYIPDYQYFPLEIGQYQIYEINESVYSVSAEPINIRYYLKERISESYSNAIQENIYKIERYKRQNIRQSWKIDSVWTTQISPNKVIRTENNIAFVKLFFPIQSAQFWNKNELNALPEEKVRYKNIQETYQIDEKNYKKTISVIIKNDSSLLSKNKNIEIYAPTYGIIYQEKTNLAYCQSSPTCIGKKIIEYGIEQKIKLIEMGIER